jgi:hypothetical protein
MKQIGIIGCGWLGLHIARHLSTENKIYTTTTSELKKDSLLSLGFDAVTIKFPDDELLKDVKCWEPLNDLDVIIITVPFSKQTRIQHLQNRFNNICSFISGFQKNVFLMSSTGIYPYIDIDIEEDTFEDYLLEQNILFVENLIRSKFPQTNILRLGGLMGADRVFSNYKISSPYQVVNHVHYTDICLVIDKIIVENMYGKTYNVVAPLHPRKIDVINYQKGIKEENPKENQIKERKVLTNLLERELDYKYTYPDPRKFE